MEINLTMFIVLLSATISVCSGMKLGQVINFELFSVDNRTLSSYLTKISIGTPPKILNVIVDTGSYLTWVDCSNHGPSFFEPANSSTALVCPDGQGMSCKYDISYKDGSTSKGYMVSDVIHFSTYLLNSSLSQLSAPIKFGCSLINTLDPRIDGIIGLDQTDGAIISQLFKQRVAPKIVSQCLSENRNGYIILGEAVKENFTHSPLVPSTTHYGVSLESVSIGGIQINAKAFEGKYGTIFDSGTVRTLLVAGVYDSIVDVVSSAVGVPPHPGHSRACYDIPSSDRFPKIKFNLAHNAILLVLPQDYLLSVDSLWCIGFERDEDITILGDLVLREKIVVYDQHREQMGWLSQNCSLPINISLSYNLTSGTWSDMHLSSICWICFFFFVVSLVI